MSSTLHPDVEDAAPSVLAAITAYLHTEHIDDTTDLPNDPLNGLLNEVIALDSEATVPIFVGFIGALTRELAGATGQTAADVWQDFATQFTAHIVTEDES